ncbi:ArsR/SmtB family transcription factor [Kordiimonas aestuarii]|uniref:ArsR/SmtB family transcription factor n=1 Tax=Kordiimonas aestuarii TaxID=1005925 RepID=UPI0021CF04ED|nr:metalloregulator ArsR/SmtB family transcription factor [Kordiimonas aestuarii]
MTNNAENLDIVFQALADKTRRTVLQRLADGPLTVSELASPFEMALPSFMQHLKVLEDSGLIRSRKEGRVRTCEITPMNLVPAESWIIDQRKIWQDRFNRLDGLLLRLQKQDQRHDSDE